MKNCHALLLTGMLLTSAIGCAPSPSAPAVTQTAPDAKYMATSEPAGAVGVGAARETAKDEEDVVLVGRIGGSTKPFVDGVAAFTIVDPKVPYCSKEEGCKTPWDYCCEQNQVKNNIAMVRFVDGGQKTVTTDARQLLGVKELNVIVVHGKAKRDADGNLTVLADQVFVKE
ncbi:hypothetical protein [Planctomicrobium piriforme]|uniref:Uncharacterized protein n=1 Tax=Planctomicrobium piriforme TaxID=1576369 RepID=A0A1I3RD83_9PLAN|nr:hypothetical protein [Planctomicrobium piriforme]SFJ43321.1 hypothetical protein SAMN05421753_12067 [Planctomicrobium piriforme]